MKKISLSNLIDVIMFIYILSIYIFTYREGLNLISNGLAFILICLIWINSLSENKNIIINRFSIIHLLFICICIFSIFFAIDQDISLSKVETLVLIFLVMISLINYADTYEKLEKIITYFIFSGLISSIYILISSDFSELGRLGGELGNQNVIGIIIGTSVVFCLYMILELGKYWYILNLLIMVPTTLLTGSRQALLFLIINIILIIYFKNRSNFRNMLKFVIVSIFLILIAYYIIFNVPLFYQIIGHRIENLFSFMFGRGTKEGSISMRAYMVKFGLKAFNNKPFMGYGIDNYRVLLGEDIGRSGYAHNNYIELMVDIGVIGTFIYYFTHIIVLVDLFKISKRMNNKTLVYVFIGIIISYMILGVSTVYYYNKNFNFLLAIASNISRVIKSNHDREITGVANSKYFNLLE